MNFKYPDYKLVIQNYEERQSILLGYLEEQIETTAEEGNLIFDVELSLVFEGSELNQLKMYFNSKYIDVKVIALKENKFDIDNPIYTTLQFKFLLPPIE